MSNQGRDFDKAAASWDANPIRVKLAADVAEAIAREMPLGPETTVLDFGCGTGLLTLRLAGRVKSIAGADTSEGMIDQLREKARAQGLNNVHPLRLRAGDGLPGAYDAIVSCMTLHHIEDIAALLAQFHRALKPRGRLGVADLDPDQGEFHGDNAGVFHLGFERAALCRALVQAGFANVRAVTAAEVTKPARGGAPRKFGIFLLLGEKTGGG